jgi:tRNA dimethylallyltransferase
MGKNKYLIVLVGPTAVGKTDLSIMLARQFNCSIISADSRQLFREMNIGTAKPTEDQLKEVQHYFINSHSIKEDYSVGKYEEEVVALLDKLFSKNDIQILTGGSGLYVKAVCEGLDEFPDVDPEVREILNKTLEEEGLDFLLKELKFVDPVYYETVDRDNAHRVVRALEIFRQTGMPISAFRKNIRKERPFNIVKIGINRERHDLYNRIDERMERMISAGLLEEAKILYPYKDKAALQTVGYSEIFDFIDGKQSWEETERLLKRNSRRYAKRQMTWFNKDKEIIWFEAGDLTKLTIYLSGQLNSVK